MHANGIEQRIKNPRKPGLIQRKSFLAFIVLLFGFFLFVPNYLHAQESSRERLNELIRKNQTPEPTKETTENAGTAVETIETGPGDNIMAEIPGAIPIEVPKPRPLTLRDQAFKQLLDKISPLSPDQIVEMRKAQDQTQRAVATSPHAPPRPVSSTLTIDLSPGATPPVVRLGMGFVTSIVFVDSTGQSWPIADYSLGNPKNFNIQWDKKTNTLFMQSTTAYNSGNLAVRLAKLDTPVMLSLVSGQKEVDYRVDLQVPGRGPNALAAIVGDSLPPPPDSILLSVLDGVPPPGSEEMQVGPGCGRAWIWNGKLIFRTQLTVLSPAWTATVSSIDGTHVYEMMPTPLILASKNGKPVKIEVKGM